MEVTATTAALATLGAASIGTGGGFLALSKRPKEPPRYRILDNVKKRGYWSYDGAISLQRRFLGRWWTIKKARIQTDRKYVYVDSLETLSSILKVKLLGEEHFRDPKVLFDTKFDDINQLGAA